MSAIDPDQADQMRRAHERATEQPIVRSDAVNHPPHYQAGGLEVIDIIEAFGLGFRLGNTVKYILRAGRKVATVEDLMKARWYLDREIASMEAGRGR